MLNIGAFRKTDAHHVFENPGVKSQQRKIMTRTQRKWGVDSS
jgi:hypothetical protein